MPSNRTATKARAISRNRSIIGCPLTGSSLSRRLTVDGVDNKANGRFCRLAGMGMGEPWWYSLPQSGVPSGAIRVRIRAVSMFTSRRLSARPRSIRGPWQIGHTAGAISAAPQEVAVAAQLQGWMLAWDISGACQITSEHFWIDGGD